MRPTRGRVYLVDAGYGPKPWLCVSNNSRNQYLGTWIGVRLTTTPKTARRTIVETIADDGLSGRVLCDDIEQLGHDEIRKDMGALSPATMILVQDGLRAALSL